MLALQLSVRKQASEWGLQHAEYTYWTSSGNSLQISLQVKDALKSEISSSMNVWKFVLEAAILTFTERGSAASIGWRGGCVRMLSTSSLSYRYFTVKSVNLLVPKFDTLFECQIIAI